MLNDNSKQTDVMKNCVELGLDENQAFNVLDSLDDSFTNLELGYSIFNASSDIKKWDISKKLKIHYDALDLVCKNFGAKRNTWA